MVRLALFLLVAYALPAAAAAATLADATGRTVTVPEKGSDPVGLAALFNASVYGRVLTAQQLRAIAGDTLSFH